MALRVGAGMMKAGKAASRIITAVPSASNGLKMGLMTDLGRRAQLDGGRQPRQALRERAPGHVDPSRYFFYKAAMQFDIQNLDYPRSPSWMIFDETLRKASASPRAASRRSATASSSGRRTISTPSSAAGYLKGNTLEELAAKIKAHEDNRKLFDDKALVATRSPSSTRPAPRARTSSSAAGSTPAGTIDKPPYYAMPLYAGGPNTKGSISANARREVLDWSGKPIPRLFTAGEISSVFKFVYQGGGNLTECITFGRIAGENAAKQKAWG